MSSKATFYQVGGSVRDELLGLESKDIDYAVEAESFSALREAIIERGGTIFLETPQYFIIRANVPTFGACDFVLCRKDGAYSDGRHPETVTPGTIYDDLARRDFTINAIAKDETGVILDPYDGRGDLKLKLIKCVGDARNRFDEDGLRLIRAFRFAITKGFELEPVIEDLLNNEDYLEARLKGVSIERVYEELMKAFTYSTPDTLDFLIHAPDLRRWLFKQPGLWLKPTLETR